MRALYRWVVPDDAFRPDSLLLVWENLAAMRWALQMAVRSGRLR